MAIVKPQKKGVGCAGWGGCLAVVIILILLLPCCMGPIAGGVRHAQENAAMQGSHTIEIAMFQYANDHNGAYPDGKTSTEVFQKLLDGTYITDPAIFYISGMPGKQRMTTGKLTAENVSYDVTSGVGQNSPDDVPMVFSTGYTVIYAPGANAMRNLHASQPFNGDGIAVTYKNNNARFTKAASDGSIPVFIPTNFNAGNKTYRQLKP